MGVASLVHINFDLLSVGIAIAGTVLLGTIIILNDARSATNRTFLYFSLLTALWGVSNYLEYRFSTVDAALLALRIHLFISTLHAFLFFQLAYVFPKTTVAFPRWYRFVLVPLVVAVMILVLTPLVFSGITALAPVGQVTRATPGPGIVVFMLTAFGLLLAGLILLLRRARAATGVERRQSFILFAGMLLTAALILTFNVVLPNVFSDTNYIPLAALFIFPFVALTFYAIYRHHLFNLKVATTAFLGFMVTVFTFVNVLYSTTMSEVVINVTAFLIVLIGSIRILQDTVALKTLTEELSETNERQEGLLHFIGHEVKGFMAKDEGAFAALVDGDFGALPDGMKPFVAQALAQARAGVRSVTDILTASNQKKGTMTYAKEPFDLKALAEEVIQKEKPMAEAKGLALSFSADPAGAPYTVNGDRAKIGDSVLRNLVENSIHYTPSGSISVALKKEQSRFVFTVEDTGIGITDEDKRKLFTEGGHGKDSQRVNAHSTGYGLYIAKNIVDAHGGSIKAESAGAGKGSVFTVELPA